MAAVRTFYLLNADAGLSFTHAVTGKGVTSYFLKEDQEDQCKITLDAPQNDTCPTAPQAYFFRFAANPDISRNTLRIYASRAIKSELEEIVKNLDLVKIVIGNEKSDESTEGKASLETKVYCRILGKDLKDFVERVSPTGWMTRKTGWETVLANECSTAVHNVPPKDRGFVTITDLKDPFGLSMVTDTNAQTKNKSGLCPMI